MSEQSVGRPLDRKDGRLKVTGGAKYTADMPVDGLVYAALAGSEIAKSRLLHLDTKAAEAAPGVLAVLTHRTLPKLAEAPVLLSQAATPRMVWKPPRKSARKWARKSFRYTRSAPTLRKCR